MHGQPACVITEKRNHAAGTCVYYQSSIVRRVLYALRACAWVVYRQ